MGVKQLWRVLEDVGETVPVSQAAGQVVAVDLGSWIGESTAVARTASLSALTSLTRNVFHRTLNLMRLGLRLVIVVDGRAPDIKVATLQQRSATMPDSTGNVSVERRHFAELARECCGLFEALGLPVIWCPGEAEKMCAHLNQQGIVDACLTEDSDVLLYGAETVYRNFSQNGKDFKWERFMMADVKKKMDLERDDLVVFALLGGCDYDIKGITSIGPENVKQLIAEIKARHANPLERLKTWGSSEELATLSATRTELLNLKKEKHCKLCCHTGAENLHKAKGCQTCQTPVGCESNAPRQCQCAWHQMECQVAPFHLELKIRAKALSAHPAFPDMRIIEEYMSAVDPVPPPSWTAVDVKAAVSWAQRVKSLTRADAQTKVLETLALTTCHQSGKGPLLSPVRIHRKCKENFEDCFEVEWKADEQSEIMVKVPQKIFMSRFPNIVKSFETSQTQGKKRKKLEIIDEKQTKLTNFFKVTKKDPGTSLESGI